MKSENRSEGDFGKSWKGDNKPLNPTRERQVEIVLEIADLVSPNSILDLGCGPGYIAERLLDCIWQFGFRGIIVGKPIAD